MPTINPPSSQAQSQSTVGFSFVFAEQQIRRELAEQLNVLQMGLVSGVGDVAATGSDTLRVVRFGGLGFAEEMQSLSSETEAIVPSGYTLGEDEVTVGRYGLAKAQTYAEQGQQRPGMVDLELMIAQAPASWLKSLRSAVVTSGSTFSASSGTTGAVYTMDDELDMIAAFHETEGFDPMVHRPVTIRRPGQFTDLRESIRNEPGFQADSQLMQSLMGLGGNSGDAQGAFQFLGFRNFSSHDVPASGGDWLGCAYVPGAIAWCVMSTASIRTANPGATMVIPEFGIILEEKSQGGIASGSFDMNAWFGVANLDPTLFPQRKLRSLTH